MSYEQCLSDAMRMYRVENPTDRCKQLAQATFKMKMKYAELRKEKENRTIQMIERVPEKVAEKRHVVHTCQAVTLTGKPCGFKAVCGNFCKKHQPKIKY